MIVAPFNKKADKLIGKIFKPWRVMGLIGRQSNRRYFMCECTTCGDKKVLKYEWLLEGRYGKCQECKLNAVVGFLSKDWRVVCFLRRNKYSDRLYRCKCDRCGNSKTFSWTQLRLKSVGHCTFCWRWRGRYGWELRLKRLPEADLKSLEENTRIGLGGN